MQIETAPMNQGDFVVFSMSLRLLIGFLSGLGAIPPEQNNSCLTKKGDTIGHKRPLASTSH
jgi:hypothetical protein